MSLRLLSALLVVIAGLVFAACGGDDDGGSDAEGDSASKSITTADAGKASGKAVKIGLLTGLTGDYAPWGEKYVAATQVAADEINEAGGILGRPLEIVVADSESNLEGAVARWPRLAEVEKVVAVQGVESDGGVALLESAAEAQIPIICSVCGTPTLDERGGDYVWRMIGGDNQIGVALAQIALEHTKEASIMTEQGLETTEGISDIFESAFEKGGGDLKQRVNFGGDAGTFQAELEQAFGDTDQVFLASGLEPALRIFNEWQRRNYGGTFFAPPDWISPEVAKFGDGALEGKVFGVGQAFPEDSPAYKRFAAAYEAILNESPSSAFNEPPLYDGLIVLALAAEAAGKAEGKAIRDHLAEVANPPGKVVQSYADGIKELRAGNDIEYQGASGTIDFDEHGSVAALYAEVTPEDGDWKVTRTFEVDTSLQP
jgi:ABC-type branched-subunit amino acid transport system substrate-binding protein